MNFSSFFNQYFFENQLKLCDFQEEERFKVGDMRKSMVLSEFQQNFLAYFSENPNNNPLVELKPLFLILCYEEALARFKNIDSYFNDFVHILIVIRESGLIFDFSDEKCKQVSFLMIKTEFYLII